MATPGKAVIVGGGIGGAAACMALQRAGWTVRLLEQAPQFGEVGAGLTIGSSASRALDGLGLGAVMRTRADIPSKSGVLDYQTYLPVAARSGQGAAPIDEASPAAATTWFHQMHRADFHAMLIEAVVANDPDAVRLGAAVVEVRAQPGGATAVMADGSTDDGDIVIGADGIRSKVRAQLFDDGPPRFTGQVAFRCMIPLERVDQFLDGYWSSTVMGPGAIFTRYAIRGRQWLNCVGIVQTNSWTETGWMHPATREEFASHFKDWHPNVRGIIAAAPEGSIFKWALSDREPLVGWRRGRVALLGDAAHPLLPFLGLGAAMAIEDGAILARALDAAPDHEAGLDLYEATRRPRTTETLLRARRQGEVYQKGSAADYLKGAPPSLDRDFMDYDATTAPLGRPAMDSAPAPDHNQLTPVA